MALFENDLFSGVSGTAKAASRSKKRKKAFDDELSLSDLPPLTPEQEQGLISRALGGGVSGLQWLGETLDKPRRALYGALAGSREALNFIPFSDTLGITDPAETITGRDALEAAGVLGKNQDGLDMGDVAGFLFELPTDPLNFVSLGAKSAASGAIKAGTSAASKLDDIAKGATSIARLTTPDIGIPLTKFKTTPRTLEMFGKPLEWTGESAAKFYDNLNYGKYSPVPYVRKVFSGNEAITNTPVQYQKEIDLKTDAVKSATESSGGDILELFRLKDQARKATEKLRTDQIIGTDPIQMRTAKAKVVSNIAAIDPSFKSVVDDRLKPFNLSDDFGNTAPSATAAKAEESLASLYDEAMDIKNGYGKVGEKLTNELYRLRDEIAQGAANAPKGEEGWWDDLLADLSETKTPSMAYYGDLLKNLGYSDSLDSFTATTKAYDEMVNFVRKKYDEFENKMRTIGVDIGKYENPFVAYSHRSATKQYAKDAAQIDASRSGILGKMKRSLVNAVAKQLAGLSKDKTKAQQWVESLDQDTLNAMKTEKVPSKQNPAHPLYEASVKAGVSYKDALDYATGKRKVDRDELEAMRELMIGTAKEIMGSNWYNIIAAEKKKPGFATYKIPGFMEVVSSIAAKKGITGRYPEGFAQEIFTRLSHDQPVAQFKPRKLADKSLIAEAVEHARKLKESRAADGIEATTDAKFNLELVAEFLKRNGVAWNGDFNANMRRAIAEHTDQDFAALAQRGDIDDETFAALLKQTADAKGYTTNIDNVTTPDDLLEYMHMNDPAVKGAGGASHSEILDLAKWFTNLPEGVRQTGFFDRDVVMDIADYYQQAHRKIAQASILRSFFKDNRFIGTLGKDGNDLSIYDTWKGAGMTDEGLLTLMAERRGQNYAEVIADYSAKQKAALDSGAPDAAKIAQQHADDRNAYIKGLYGEARNTGMPSSLARGLINTGKVFAGKNEPSWLGKLTDRFRTILQASLYTPWLASHNRNHIGGVALNAIAGVFDVQSYADAYKLFRGKNLDDDFIREALKQAIATGIMKSSHPSGFTSQEMLEELVRAVENPNSQIAGKGLLATMADPIKVMMGQVQETYKAKGVRAATKQALFGGELPGGGSATGLLNFWEVRGGLSPGDAKRNLGGVDANGKPLDTLDRWKSNETRVLPMQVGEQLSAYVEFQNRMQPFLYLLRKGWNPHAAALKVKELHFDYGSLNSFEKKVLRRNILFYDFMRKNLELQSKLLFTQPGGTTSKIVRAENRLQDESKGKEGFIPSHLREGFTVRLPGEVEGHPGVAKFWNQSGLLPIEEAVGRFAFDREGFPLAIRRTAEKFASQLAPWFSAPIEQFSGRQLSTGRPLKDLYQYPTGDMETDFWIAKSPLSRAVSTIRTLTDPRKTIEQKLFNTTIGGARVTDVNVPMTRLLEGRRAVQESLASDPDIGQYEALYARDLSSLVERAKNGDDSALAQLQLYQQLRNEIRNMRKNEKK